MNDQPRAGRGGAWRRAGGAGAVLALAFVAARAAIGAGPGAGDTEVAGFERLGKNAQGLLEYRHGRTGLVFVRIPGGRFAMGSPPGELGRFDTEGPVHTVQVKPFLLAKTELTQAAWKKVMGTAPWWGQNFSRNGADFPASHISWDDCQAFARKTGLRFPSEAEWEYACRAGSPGRYCFGDDERKLGDFAWFSGNTWEAGERYVHRVGRKKPNAFGLHDVHGNVSEWCEDTWHRDYQGAPTDGRAWVDVAADPRRILRGGSWVYDAWDCRCASRIRNGRAFLTDHLGFRPAASLPEGR